MIAVSILFCLLPIIGSAATFSTDDAKRIIVDVTNWICDFSLKYSLDSDNTNYYDVAQKSALFTDEAAKIVSEYGAVIKEYPPIDENGASGVVVTENKLTDNSQRFIIGTGKYTPEYISISDVELYIDNISSETAMAYLKVYDVIGMSEYAQNIYWTKVYFSFFNGRWVIDNCKYLRVLCRCDYYMNDKMADCESALFYASDFWECVGTTVISYAIDKAEKILNNAGYFRVSRNTLLPPDEVQAVSTNWENDVLWGGNADTLYRVVLIKKDNCTEKKVMLEINLRLSDWNWSILGGPLVDLINGETSVKECEYTPPTDYLSSIGLYNPETSDFLVNKGKLYVVCIVVSAIIPLAIRKKQYCYVDYTH